MFLRIAFVVVLAAPPSTAAAKHGPASASFEDLIDEATRQQDAGNPIEASDTFRRAFEAMPADVKRQDIGEDVAATLHFEARYTAWLATRDPQHLEEAKRVLEILLAEQRADVTAGTRAAVSVDAEQKLAVVKDDIAFAKRQTVVAPPDPVVRPMPTTPVLRVEPPDLTTPIALLSVGSVLGVAGLACILGGEASRAFNKKKYEDSPPEDQAMNQEFLGNINRTSTGVTMAGAIALLGGVAMVIPGAILYKRRTSANEIAVAPLRLGRGGGITVGLRF